MMVPNIFRPLYVTLTFAHNNHCFTTIIFIILDNNAFGFNKCNFGIISGFKKKAHNFSNSVNKTHRVHKFPLSFLRVEKAFCIKQYLLKVSKLMKKYLAQTKIYNYFNTEDFKSVVKLKKKYSKFPKSCSYTHLSASFEGFFASFVLSFCQSTKLLAEIVTIAYSSLK